MESDDFEILMKNLEKNKDNIIEVKDKEAKKEREKKEKQLKEEKKELEALNVKYSDEKQTFYPNK